MHIILPAVCPLCGRIGEVLCHDCAGKLLSRNEYKYNNFTVYSAADYESAVKQLILKLKYNGFKIFGKILGIEMAKIFNKPDIDALVPVPLHIGSRRKYNQAFEIASGLGSQWDIKVADVFRWSKIMPRRAGMSFDERMELTPDAFKIVPDQNVNNKNKIKINGLRIALVDDVFTTGLTLQCLAELCEEAGAQVKAAYVIAKA